MRPRPPGSTAQAAPLHVQLRGSPLLMAALVGLTLLAAIAIELSQLPRVLWLLLPPWLVFVLWRLRRDLPLKLVFFADGRVRRLDADGQEENVQILDWQERGPLWLLRLRQAQSVRTLCGSVDVLTREERRALRLWWARHALPRSSPPASR